MSILLRDYQRNIVSEIRKNIKEGKKHILIQLPTGGGKTVIFSYISQHAAEKENNVLIITDRDELLSQAGETIKNFNINCAYIKAGSKFIDRRKNIFVAMSQTLRNRIHLPEWKAFIKKEISLIIIDEAHIQEFNYLFESGIFDNKKVIGFTATPVRTRKMRQLGSDYEILIRGGEPRDLIDAGFLLNCDILEFESPNMEGVSVNELTGDYQAKSMFDRYNKDITYQGLIKNYKKHAEGKKMLVFCCNVEHAIKTTDELNKAGYLAKFVCSEKSPPKAVKNVNDPVELAHYNEKLRKFLIYKENYEKYSGNRKDVFRGFKNNEFTVLVNVDIATKGYDCPDIEVITLYRSTKSLQLYLQMIGRGSRLHETKDSFIVFDFGGNKITHGSYDQNRDWSLWHNSKDIEGVAPVKECGINSDSKPIKSGNEIKEGCKRMILASYNMCPFCGFKYLEKNPASEIDLVLEKIKDENGVSLKSKSFKDMDWSELTKYRFLKKHKTPWLWRQLWLKGKEKEIISYGEKYGWDKKTTNTAVNYCKTNLI